MQARLLFALFLAVASTSAAAQRPTLYRTGTLSRADSAIVFRLEVSGDCAHLGEAALFEGLRCGGYGAVLDGERRRSFGSRQVSVIVGDSVLRRSEPTVELYRLFESPPADYVLLLYGDLGREVVRRPLIQIVNRATGQLEMVLDGTRDSHNMKYETLAALFCEELRAERASGN